MKPSSNCSSTWRRAVGMRSSVQADQGAGDGVFTDGGAGDRGGLDRDRAGAENDRGAADAEFEGVLGAEHDLFGVQRDRLVAGDRDLLLAMHRDVVVGGEREVAARR